MDTEPVQSPAPAVPVTPSPAQEPATTAPAKSSGSYGTILGIILIVVILVMGAFYVWGARLESEQPQQTQQDTAEGSIQVDVQTPQPN